MLNIPRMAIRIALLSAIGILVSATGAIAQNLSCIAQTTTEVQVNTYALPNALLMQNGAPVTTVDQWNTQRRPQLLDIFDTLEYGRAPAKPANMTFQVFDNTAGALNGKARRKQVTIYFNGQANGPKTDLLLYLPAQATGPAPVFLGVNFWGNEMINADPGIRLDTNWIEASNSYNSTLATCVQNHKATASCRGSNSSQWPLDSLFAHGYGLATFSRVSIDPDTMTSADTVNYTNFKKGLYALYPELQGRRDNFTAIGAWAWTLSRAMDYLQTDSAVDAKRIVVFGWSRLGKTAVWAGAKDQRFAMVISIQSGAGGVALAKRLFGEDVCRLVTHFPHWFCPNFKRYSNNETNLTFDQHELIAAIAPRPVYASSAQNDANSDPKGEFLGLKGAEPVYRLFGLDTLPAAQWPTVETPVMGSKLGYHVRKGNHDVTIYDWSQYLRFADRNLTAVTSVVPRAGRTRAGAASSPVGAFSLDGRQMSAKPSGSSYPQRAETSVVRSSGLDIGMTVRVDKDGNASLSAFRP
jgi:hypothetical protein